MNVVIVGCGSGMGVGKTLMVALIMTDMHLSACESQEQVNPFEEPTVPYKIERTYFPDDEPYLEKIHLNKLHELHPFAKFMGNKKKNW